MNRQDPPTEMPGGDDRPSAEHLHALAAGDLPRAEAEALQALIREDPALEARYEEIRRLEVALRGLVMLAPPADLAARVVEGLPAPGRVLSIAALGRLAVAVVVMLGAWFLAFGTAPGTAYADTVLADMPLTDSVLSGAVEPVRDLLPTPAIALPATSPDVSPLAAVGLLALGLAVLLLGLRVARRAYRPNPAQAEEMS